MIEFDQQRQTDASDSSQISPDSGNNTANSTGSGEVEEQPMDFSASNGDAQMQDSNAKATGSYLGEIYL